MYMAAWNKVMCEQDTGPNFRKALTIFVDYAAQVSYGKCLQCNNTQEALIFVMVKKMFLKKAQTDDLSALA